ncbi:MAG: hypothetical protein ABL984_05285 [Pyrinomonadaceae bacterium]
MRKPGTFVLFSLFALLAFLSIETDAQTRAIRRLGDVLSIYVDRDSFDIADAPCRKMVNGVWQLCSGVKKKRAKFLDALERWIGKYGINVAKDAASADAVLKGLIDMEMPSDPPISIQNRKRGDILENQPLEDWNVEAWLESGSGSTLWRSGRVDAPMPGYGWSTIDKIKGKELAKEIEYSIRKDR